MKRIKALVVLFLVFSMVLTFAACGQPSAGNKENPMKGSGVDFTAKVPDTGAYLYFNVSKDDTKALEDFQKKLLDKGISPMLMSGMNEDVKGLIDDMKKVMDKYKDITDRQFGVFALDMQKIKSLEDKEPSDINIGPQSGIYLVGVITFTKEVKVKDYLGDVKGIVDKLQREDESTANIEIIPDEGKITIKGEEEDVPTVNVYFEQDGKNIIVTLGVPYSKMEKVDSPISGNEFWKEATAHSFALYFDVKSIPDEQAREELINAGWQKPLKVYGDLTSTEKGGVYKTHGTLKIYNPTDKQFDDLGIPGDVKVVKSADLILALDMDLLGAIVNELPQDEDIAMMKQYVDMFAGGVMTLSLSVQSMDKIAGALIGQYFKNSDQLWGMIQMMVSSYLQAAKQQMPGLYTKQEKTSDGFDIVVGTFQPSMEDEKISGTPLLYLKLRIDPSKYADIVGNMDEEAASVLQKYAEVVENSESTLSVSYDKKENSISVDIMSTIATK